MKKDAELDDLLEKYKEPLKEATEKIKVLSEDEKIIKDMKIV